MAKMTTLLFVTLLIDRDASTKLPTTVAEYEQSILEEIYGEEQVFEVSSRVVEVSDFDVGAAFAGLVAKYGSNADSDKARALYFNRERDLERFIASRQPDASAGKRQTRGPKATKGAKPEEPQSTPPADEPTLDAEGVKALLAKEPEAIVVALADLSAADLVAVEAAETEGEGREDVLAAIDDESEKRKA